MEKTAYYVYWIGFLLNNGYRKIDIGTPLESIIITDSCNWL